MLINFLTNTPFYVYWIFFSLLFVGISQLRTRSVGLKRALIIPIVLIILSIYGLISDFGITLFSTSIWIVGMILALILNSMIKKKKEIIYFKETKTFMIAGSFIPLTMMMLLFCVKYTVGAVTTLELEVLYNSSFIGIFSLLYGIFTGTYLLRFYVLIEKMKMKTEDSNER